MTRPQWLLNELSRILYDGSPSACRKKLHLLDQLDGAHLRTATSFRQLHRLCLFLMAYPCSLQHYRKAEQVLRGLAGRIPNLPATLRLRLENSALPGSTCTVSLSYHLVSRFNREATLSLRLFSVDASAEETESALSVVLPPLLFAAVADRHLSARRQLQLLLTHGKDALGQLLSWFEAAELPASHKELVWQQLKVYVHFAVPGSAYLPLNRQAPVYLHRQGLLRQAATGRQSRLVKIPLTAAQQDELVFRARLALASRQRETDPITYADVRKTELFDAGRGLHIALFYMLHEHRLPLETYVGYLIVKNEIPMAYGGSWMFQWRARTGIHVFSEFRGGESAWAFFRVLRLYHQRFGVTQFVADPFQLGYGNADGIRSGAYWFYHRLGFRLTDPGLRRLAELEEEAISRDRRHRTAAAVLRRFAASSVELRLHARKKSPDPRQFAERLLQGGQRQAGAAASPRLLHRRLIGQLGERNLRRWPDAEREAFYRMAPLLRVVNWQLFSPKEKGEILQLIRRKGSDDEAAFVTGTQESPAWQKLLDHLLSQ